MEALYWHTEQRIIGDLVPADYNPRKLSDKQATDLKQSLERFGLAEPIVINDNNVVIGGHQRLKMLAELYGRQYEVQVSVPNRALTLEEEKELNIRLNRNVGEWDWDVLNANFETEKLLDWGFQSFEFGVGSKPVLDFVTNKEAEDGEETIEYEGNDLAASHVRMVQLFLTTETQPQLNEFVELLKKHYQTDNLTDTVFRAVEDAYGKYKELYERESDNS